MLAIVAAVLFLIALIFELASVVLIVAVVAVGIALATLGWLVRLAAAAAVPRAEMPAWGRRRFLVTSASVVGVAAASGLAGLAEAAASAQVCKRPC